MTADEYARKMRRKIVPLYGSPDSPDVVEIPEDALQLYLALAFLDGRADALREKKEDGNEH